MLSLKGSLFSLFNIICPKGSPPSPSPPPPLRGRGAFPPKTRPVRGSLPSSPIGPFSTRLVISRSLVYNSVRGFVLCIFTTIIIFGVCLIMSNNQLIPSQSQVDTEALLRLRTRLLPPYSVVLHDDDYNEMNYVIFVLLHAINNLSQPQADRIMLTAHLTGSAIAAVCPKETAEFYQERLLSYGLTATIEPA